MNMTSIPISTELLGLSAIPVATALGLLLRSRLQSQKAQRALQEAPEAAKRAQTCDPHTGVLNRRGIDMALNERSTAAEADHSKFCAICLAIDEFSFHSCSFGQEFSERLLQLVIQRLHPVLDRKSVV